MWSFSAFLCFVHFSLPVVQCWHRQACTAVFCCTWIWNKLFWHINESLKNNNQLAVLHSISSITLHYISRIAFVDCTNCRMSFGRLLVIYFNTTDCPFGNRIIFNWFGLWVLWMRSGIFWGRSSRSSNNVASVFGIPIEWDVFYPVFHCVIFRSHTLMLSFCSFHIKTHKLFHYQHCFK